jgi:hypothetical protein
MTCSCNVITESTYSDVRSRLTPQPRPAPWCNPTTPDQPQSSFGMQQRRLHRVCLKNDTAAQHCIRVMPGLTTGTGVMRSGVDRSRARLTVQSASPPPSWTQLQRHWKCCRSLSNREPFANPTISLRSAQSDEVCSCMQSCSKIRSCFSGDALARSEHRHQTRNHQSMKFGCTPPQRRMLLAV